MKKRFSIVGKKRYKMSSSQTRLQRPGSTASLSFPKGLLNAPGENNCFLNSAVQVLWHLDVFRHSFRNYTGHACMGNSCIFCALKVIFTQFQYGEEQALPPDALRHALAQTFKNQQRFQLGCMDDAAECFENILCRIHFHVAHDIKEDLCNVKHCVPHRKFGMTLVENSKCRCGATSEPFPFTQMVNYVSCKALCSEFRKSKIRREPRTINFGELLCYANAVGDRRDCPSNCGKRITIQRIVTNSPEVVSVGLVWDTDRPSVDHIMDVINCLGTTVMLKDIFYNVLDDKTRSTKFILVGVVTYYGKHYSTFFYNTRLKIWVYFDDASVKKVGPNWKDVVERCRKGHYQPLLLIFADPNGREVSMDTAPTDTIFVNGPSDSDDFSDVDTFDGQEREVYKSVNPLPVNHNHYNSTSSSASTHSYKSFTSFDSANTVIYKPSPDDLKMSNYDSRPPKPARSNSSEMFRPVKPIPEFQPQIQSVDGNFNGKTSRTATANQNWGVVEIGRDVRKLITDEMAYPSEEYYRNEERRQLEEYANQKREKDYHKAVADQMISTLRTETAPTSNMHTPKFPDSKDLIDLTQERTYKKHNESRRKSGEYDDQQTWINSMKPELLAYKPPNMAGSKPKRQPSFQFAVGADYPHTKSKQYPEVAGGPDRNKIAPQRPQSAMNRSEPGLSQTNHRAQYNEGHKQVIGGRPQSARPSQHTNSRNNGNYTVPSNQASSTSEHRRSLVSSRSVPDLTEKLAFEQMTHKGYREDPEVSLRATQQPRQYTDRPDRNYPINNNVQDKSTSSKMPTYKSPQILPQSRSPSMGSYNVQSGFVTLPRKRQSVPMKADHVSEMVVKGNYPINDNGRNDYQPASTTLTSGVLDQFHQIGYGGQPKSDALEVGSLGRDSGYRSGDRNSTSSGSIYSIDMLGDYQSANGSPYNNRSETSQHNPKYTMTEMPANGAVYTTANTNTTMKQNWQDLVCEANKLIKKSTIAEDSDDLAVALSIVSSAIMNIKQALKISYLDPATKILLENMYHTTVARSRSIHSRLQVLQRQDSNQSSNTDEDDLLHVNHQVTTQFQNMSLSHSKTFPVEHQRYQSDPHHLPANTQIRQEPRRNRKEAYQSYTPVTSTYPQVATQPKPADRYSIETQKQRYTKYTSLQEPVQSNYPQYSQSLKVEASKMYSHQKYTEPQHLYRAQSCIKMPQYATAGPPDNLPTPSLHRTHSAEMLDQHDLRRPSVKHKISMFERQPMIGGQTEVKGHYTAQDLYRPESKSVRDYSQENYKTENRQIRRTQTLSSNATQR
ncbi:uncharacterized protein [Antedon mediterranea]|uniref:uncharacterized protein isoform X2 n=1 Tax=Antedon mediterranea TaxID=105859 RepID=UPI003AF7FDDD